MIEKVGSMMPFIRKTGLFRPVPMNLVRITEQHRIITLAKVEQKIQLIFRDIIEHGDPSGIDLLVRQRLLRQMTDAFTKFRCSDGTKFDLHKKIFVLVIIDLFILEVIITPALGAAYSHRGGGF